MQLTKWMFCSYRVKVSFVFVFFFLIFPSLFLYLFSHLFFLTSRIKWDLTSRQMGTLMGMLIYSHLSACLAVHLYACVDTLQCTSRIMLQNILSWITLMSVLQMNALENHIAWQRHMNSNCDSYKDNLIKLSNFRVCYSDQHAARYLSS